MNRNSTNLPLETNILDCFPRLGWVKEPTYIIALNKLGKSLKINWLGCKRDDLCSGLFGGNKVRKLDFLLASEPYCEAPAWTSIGATGSGHLVACTAAAKTLGRKFYPHIFWEPISEGVIDNLAFTVSGSAGLSFYRSRKAMILSKPSLFLKDRINGLPLIPLGATCAIGMLGFVRAGLELAEQVRNEELPEPNRIYAAYGTGGTVAGLSVGLALGGLKTRIRAIAVVERIFTTKYHINRLIAKLIKTLSDAGIKEAVEITPAPIDIDRSQLGPGYGAATKMSLIAVEVLKKTGINIEPVYTGKAAAAMLVDLKKGFDEPVLFWNTKRGPLPDIDDNWKEKLPGALKKRLKNI